MNVLIALFAGLYYALASSLIGYTLQKCMKQPIIVAFFFRICMGNLHDANPTGQALELGYCGLMAPGGTMPADECLAAVIAIPLALSTGTDPSAAVLLATPLAALGSILGTLRKTLNARIAISADKCAERCDLKGLARRAWFYGIGINTVIAFPGVFVAVLLGQQFVKPVLDALPAWITQGVSVAGGLIPVVGFAMILYMIGKPSIFAFFFIGFFACEYLGLSVLSAAFFGIPMAVIILLMDIDRENALLQKVRSTLAIGGGEDDDDDE